MARQLKRKRKKLEKRDGLAPLPESGNKFWDGAGTEQIKMGAQPKCNHHFIRVSGREVECINCHAGFVLGPGWQLNKGHIYYKGKRAL